MKAVLISIQPKWCELIALGKKTVEVRKTKPNIKMPFKVYIYCTNNGGTLHSAYDGLHYHQSYVGKNDMSCINGKIIGEFVCDKIIKLNYSCGSYRCEGLDRVENDRIASASQLSLYDMKNYLTCKDGYAWHISDLVIYDNPKELGEFEPYCDGECTGCKYLEWIEWYHSDTCMKSKLKKPPQSWRYVNEITK